MNISVFGGSQPKEGDTAYTEAQKLGRLLAQRGHTVLTGGYIGTMEAVSRGAGTLNEIALMWNLMIVESPPRRPLILIGRGWQSTRSISS